MIKIRTQSNLHETDSLIREIENKTIGLIENHAIGLAREVTQAAEEAGAMAMRDSGEEEGSVKAKFAREKNGKE